MKRKENREINFSLPRFERKGPDEASLLLMQGGKFSYFGLYWRLVFFSSWARTTHASWLREKGSSLFALVVEYSTRLHVQEPPREWNDYSWAVRTLQPYPLFNRPRSSEPSSTHPFFIPLGKFCGNSSYEYLYPHPYGLSHFPSAVAEHRPFSTQELGSV